MVKGRIQPWKKDTLQKLTTYMEKYDVIAVADLEKVRSNQIQETRRVLRDTVEMVVAKKTILRKAAKLLESKKPNISKFADAVEGSGMLMFTQTNPYKLIVLLNRSKVRLPAKTGDIATNDILIPAGNTGLQPGPVISEFNEAKVQTRIEAGNIWVARDTVVARRGDKLAAKLASLLSKLGFKPMEAGLKLTAAFDHGNVILGDALSLDIDKFRQEVTAAMSNARILALEANYLTRETTVLILIKAIKQAIHVSTVAEFPTKLNTESILRRASSEAAILHQLVEGRTKG